LQAGALLTVITLHTLTDWNLTENIAMCTILDFEKTSEEDFVAALVVDLVNFNQES